MEAYAIRDIASTRVERIFASRRLGAEYCMRARLRVGSRVEKSWRRGIVKREEVEERQCGYV